MLTRKQLVGHGGPSMRISKPYVSASRETGNRIRANHKVVHKNWIHSSKTDKHQSPKVSYGLLVPTLVKFGDVEIVVGWKDTMNRISERLDKRIKIY